MLPPRLQNLPQRLRARARRDGIRVLRRIEALLAAAPLRTDSVLVVGYLNGNLGLGESARNLVRALEAANETVLAEPVSIGMDGRNDVPFAARRRVWRAHAVNIVEVSVAELERLFDAKPPGLFDRSYNILRVYWELSRAPDGWREPLAGFDELWVPNSFVGEACAAVFAGPISIVPPAIDVRPLVPAVAARPGAGPFTFTFFFSFDPNSFPARKNPLAVIRAFKQAFPSEAGDDVRLVLKANRSDAFGAFMASEFDAETRDGRIEVVFRNLPRREMLDLIVAADCYVSLHRAEGFGMGMAEAMALNKPVIATDYSGSRDFVTEETAFPVRFALRAVRPGEYPDAANQVWAEPDVSHCAERMREVFANPNEAARRAAAGRRLVEARYGLASVGEAASERLRAVRAQLSPASPGAPAPKR